MLNKLDLDQIYEHTNLDCEILLKNRFPVIKVMLCNEKNPKKSDCLSKNRTCVQIFLYSEYFEFDLYLQICIAIGRSLYDTNILKDLI